VSCFAPRFLFLTCALACAPPARQTLERASYLDLADTIPSLVDVLDTPPPGEEAAAAADEARRKEAEAAAREAAAQRRAEAASAAAAATAAARAAPGWHPLAESPAGAAPSAAPTRNAASAPISRPAAAAAFSLFDEDDESAAAAAAAASPHASPARRGAKRSPAQPFRAAPLEPHLAMEPLELSTAALVVDDAAVPAQASAATPAPAAAVATPDAAPTAAAPEAAAPAPAPAPAFDDPLRSAAAAAEAAAAATAAAPAAPPLQPHPLALAPSHPLAAAFSTPAGDAPTPYPFTNGANGGSATAFGTSLIGAAMPSAIIRAPPAAPGAARAPPPRRRARRADVAIRELLKVLAGRCDEMYDARGRVALRRVARHLRLSKADVTALEAEVGQALPAISLWPNLGTNAEDGDEESTAVPGEEGTAAAGAAVAAAAAANDESIAMSRNFKVAAAAAAGAGLLALTGGLAAPAIIAGAASLLPGAVAVGGGAGFIAGAAITGGFSVAGGHVAAKSMSKRTAPLKEFTFAPIPDADGFLGGGGHPRLAVTMCVSGWLQEREDFTRPWEPLSSLDTERIAVCWESEVLIKLGTALKAVMSDAGMMEVMKGGAMHTALHGVLSAVALPAAFLTATSLIDNSWARALDRADQAAVLLAAALMDGAWYLRRPVTLLGYSLGARVVFLALQRLAAAGCVGCVESVILFGAPVPAEAAEWDAVRQVTAARLVNVYSENDWVLALAYRASSLATGVAGLRPVPAEGVENINVTHLVKGHTAYPATLPKLLGVISTAPPSRRAWREHAC
jgi:hypothetical protein